MNLLNSLKTNKQYSGFGIINHQCRTPQFDEIFEEAVKELKLSKKEIFLYANSRIARFLGDEIRESKSKSKKTISNKIKSSILKYLPDLKQEVLHG